MNHGDSGEDGKEELIQEVRGLASSPSLGHPGNLRWIQWQDSKFERIQEVRGFARSPSLGHPDKLKSYESWKQC